MSGSSPLTPEQQDWYKERFGVRFVTVQEQPYRPSRRVRRGRGTQADAPVFYTQQKIADRLAALRIRPL